MPRFKTTDGVGIAAYDFGGDGPALLLAHATGFHAHVWTPLTAHLRTDFRCYALDERGHGDSDKAPHDDYDWHGFGRDVEAVVRGFDLQRPYGVGHSAGGAALLLAEIAHPGTFRALYLFEPIVFPFDTAPPPDPNSLLAVGARRRREVFASKSEALANYASKPPFAGLDPAAVAAYVEYGLEDQADGTVRLKCHRDHEALVFANGFSHGLFSHLTEVGCPVTLVFGSETTTMGDDLLSQQSARLRTSRVEEMKGLGHFGPMEDPAGVAASIVAAFAE